MAETGNLYYPFGHSLFEDFLLIQYSKLSEHNNNNIVIIEQQSNLKISNMRQEIAYSVPVKFNCREFKQLCISDTNSTKCQVHFTHLKTIMKTM